MSPWHGRDARGSASVLVVPLLGVLVTVALALAWLGGVLVTQHRLQSAVDLSAIAAASAQQRGEAACAVAARWVRRNDARLVDCSVPGPDVRVVAAVHVPGPFGHRIEVRARARAGPGSRTDRDERSGLVEPVGP